MAKPYKQAEQSPSLVQDDGQDTDWMRQEEAQLREALRKTPTERFYIMTMLMRRGIMLQNATIIRPKV
jgi:hypothetical protein